MTRPDPWLSLDAGPPDRHLQTSARILTTTLHRVKHISSSQRHRPHSCRIPKRPPCIRRHGRTDEAPKHRLFPVVHLPLPCASLSLSFHWQYPRSLRANGELNQQPLRSGWGAPVTLQDACGRQRSSRRNGPVLVARRQIAALAR